MEPLFKNKENHFINIGQKMHIHYQEILDAIKKDTSRIVIVQIGGYDENDPIVNTAKELMELKKEEVVDEWEGTYAPGRKAVQYTFKKSERFFEYLKTFHSFFICEIKGSKGPCVMLTDFGIDDISFLDKNGIVLLTTTTHEGDAYLNTRYCKTKVN